MNNLANQLADAGRREEALQAFEEASRSLIPGARAELLVSRFMWRARHDDDAAPDDLRGAAAATDDDTDPAWAGRARRAIRAAAIETIGTIPADVVTSLPRWATARLPEPAVAMLNSWLTATDWTEQEEFLRESSAALGVVMRPLRC